MSTATLLAASAVGLGLATLAWIEVAQARRRGTARRDRPGPLGVLPTPPLYDLPDVDEGTEPEPQPGGGTGPTPLEPYVGTGWTGWPHEDVFPDEASFSEKLMNFGYLDSASTCLTQNGVFLAEACAAIVGAFQQDFNLVISYMKAENMDVSIGEIEVTERLDTDTTMALVYARSIEDQAGRPWPSVVQTAEIYFS